MRVEEHGRALFDELGLGSRPPPGGAAELAVMLHGRGTLFRLPRSIDEAAPCRIGPRVRIGVRAGLPPQRANYAIARVIARLWLGRRGIAQRDMEGALAGWLVAPEVAPFGLDVGALASSCVITETCAAIRLCEAGASGVVLTPTRVYKRGSVAWLSDEDARLLVRSASSLIYKTRIRDEPGRMVAFRLSA